jgi:hypothetical protein
VASVSTWGPSPVNVMGVVSPMVIVVNPKLNWAHGAGASGIGGPASAGPGGATHPIAKITAAVASSAVSIRDLGFDIADASLRTHGCRPTVSAPGVPGKYGVSLQFQAFV